MSLTTIKTTTGTITVDEITSLGLKAVDDSTLNQDGTRTTTRRWVGAIRYMVDNEEREAEFALTAAQRQTVRDAIQADGMQAIRTKEGLSQ